MKVVNKIFRMVCLLSGFSGLALSTTSLAMTGDGCYQSFTREDTQKSLTISASVCIRGSLEEGIGGSGAHVVLVQPNSNVVFWCGKTTSISLLDGSTLYSFDEKNNRGLSAVELTPSSQEGKKDTGKVSFSQLITVGTLDYFAVKNIDEKAFQNLFNSELCTTDRN